MTKKRGNPNMQTGKTSVNPSGRGIVKAVKDGWSSLLSGMGTVGADRRLGYEYTSDAIPYVTARELWRGDPIAGKAIDLPADDMTRAGFDFVTEDNKDLQNEIEARWEELLLVQSCRRAVSYEDAYGGAGMLIGARDRAKEMSEPLDLRSIQTIDYLTVLEPRELQAATWYANPMFAKYGEVATYDLAPVTPGFDPTLENVAGNINIHESRLAIFEGLRVTREDITGTGFGDSKFKRMWNVLRDFNIAWDGTGVLVQDFSPAIFKMKDLATLMGSQGGEEKLKLRLQAINMSRSVARTVVIDEEESYERTTTPITGLSDILREYMIRMSSAADMPVDKLFGTSPSGLNANGDSTIRLWYDRVASMQRARIVPAMRSVTDAILASMGIYDLTYRIIPRPLWQEPESVIASTRYAQAQTDQIYIMNQVVAPEDISESRFGGDAYSMETVVDFKNLAALELSRAEEETALKESEAAKAKAPGADLKAKPGRA